MFTPTSRCFKAIVTHQVFLGFNGIFAKKSECQQCLSFVFCKTSSQQKKICNFGATGSISTIQLVIEQLQINYNYKELQRTNTKIFFTKKNPR